MKTRNILIVLLIIVIVAICSLFAGMFIAGGEDDVNNETNITNNTTEDTIVENVSETASTSQNTQSEKSSSTNDSGNYVTADDGTKIDLSGSHRIWSEQDDRYIYVDDDGNYKDGYIISEDKDGNINAFKDERN
mgnify:FL=1